MRLCDLKEAIDYPTYKEYCDSRRAFGLGVIPESLYEALKEDAYDEWQKNLSNS